MARAIGAACKKCRREGRPLFLKGERCRSDRCAQKRRQVPPGIHGAQLKRSKMTDYAVHLREKQKVKTYYGVLEKQFRKYYDIADRAKGNTGTNLMSILERRLDNVVYRLGLSVSRAQARQMVSHGHVTVNKRRVNIPSFLLRPGDVVSVKNRTDVLQRAKDSISMALDDVPEYLVRTEGELPEGVMLRNPVIEDISAALEVKPQLIVELCSK
ncbi:MAG: 30S ribosomal protein S4 [Planctomycetaceae bacterium]|nr:30S ribosomal protein S4 [Planctomycetaceae bacterium]